MTPSLQELQSLTRAHLSNYRSKHNLSIEALAVTLRISHSQAHTLIFGFSEDVVLMGKALEGVGVELRWSVKMKDDEH